MLSCRNGYVREEWKNLESRHNKKRSGKLLTYNEEDVMDTNKAMANIMRILVLVFVIAYVIAPIDLAPGPIDDIIIAVLGVAYNRRLAAASN